MTSVLVLGGARSGKSRYAEQLLAAAPAVRYVATGPIPDRDDEWATRVAEHRSRRPAQWRTVETADPAGVIADAAAGREPVLVDCLGTWLTRLIDDAAAWQDPTRADAVRTRAGDGLVAALAATGRAGIDIVLVSNEVGSGVVPATPAGRLFRDQLGRLNAQVAAACDRVVLAVAGRTIDLPAQSVRVAPTGGVPPRGHVGAPTPVTSDARTGDAWRLAFGTLTAWPIAPPATVDRRVAGRAMLLAPLVMLPLLALLALPAVLGAHQGAPPFVLASLLVAALVLSTRGMHLDGLADTCDGLSAGYDRERALAVMRTGDLGPSGTGAIALVLLVQTTALAELLGRSPGHLVGSAVAVLASRHVLAWACRRGVPAARSGGLGAAMAGSVPPLPLALASLLLAAVGVTSAWATGGSWWGPAVVVAVEVAAALGLVQRAITRLGGITGDVLGACVELSLTAGLAAAALLS